MLRVLIVLEIYFDILKLELEWNRPDVSIPDGAHGDIKLLFDYWRSISPEGKIPGRQHFDPIEISQILPNLWLIEVHRDPLRFWRRLVGSKIEEFAGMNLTGGWVGDRLSGARLSGVHSFLMDVVETKQPNWRRGKSLIRFEKDFAELERLYLPMATDGETVDMILAVTVFFKPQIPEGGNLNEMPGSVDREFAGY